MLFKIIKSNYQRTKGINNDKLHNHISYSDNWCFNWSLFVLEGVEEIMEIIRHVEHEEIDKYYYGDITWLDLLKFSNPKRRWSLDKEIKIVIPDQKENDTKNKK